MGMYVCMSAESLRQGQIIEQLTRRLANGDSQLIEEAIWANYKPNVHKIRYGFLRRKTRTETTMGTSDFDGVIRYILAHRQPTMPR
jgi:hypothetical protein